MGALLKEVFDRRRARTKTIPLIELVNRDPLLYELKGVRLTRQTSDGGQSAVTRIQHYQFRLRNTSGMHLHKAEIQFMFGNAEEIVPWTSAPLRGKGELVKLTPEPISENWQTAFRWKIPQFPSGDSVEFGFQAVNPMDTNYDAYLDSTSNVVLHKTNVEPQQLDGSLLERWSNNLIVIVGMSVVLSVVWSALSTYWTVNPFGESAAEQSAYDRLAFEAGYGVRATAIVSQTPSGTRYCEYQLENAFEPVVVTWVAGKNAIIGERTLDIRERANRVYYPDTGLASGPTTVRVKLVKDGPNAEPIVKEMGVTLCGELTKQ